MPHSEKQNTICTISSQPIAHRYKTKSELQGSGRLSLSNSLSLNTVLLWLLCRGSGELLDLSILLLDLLEDRLVKSLQRLLSLLRLLNLLLQGVEFSLVSLTGRLEGGKLGLESGSLLLLSLAGGDSLVDGLGACCCLLFGLLCLLLREFEGLGGFDQLVVGFLLKFFNGLCGFDGLVRVGQLGLKF